MQTIKKIIILIFSIALLSGCATYRFNHGKAPYNKGYVASRDDYTIPEYTLGRDNTVPKKIKLAKDRFNRRRNTVEDYYKRMGFIQNHFNMVAWQPCLYLMKIVGGIFCLPGIAISDYKYNNNPQYKEKIDRREKEQDQAEEERIAGLKAKVNAYVLKDLNKYEPLTTEQTKETVATAPVEAMPELKQELPSQPPEIIQETIIAETPKEESIITEAVIIPETQEPTVQSVVTNKPAAATMIKEEPVNDIESEPIETPPPAIEATPVITELETPLIPTVEEPKIEEEASPPALTIAQKEAKGFSTFIVAKPTKGFSPLKVNFSGTRSRSPYGRIIAYSWDFGDGDTSTKPNPTNTYLSGAYGSKYFTVTLTAQDDKGNTGTATATIEVINK